jgi:predicted metal-dependent HD superfamily phosphohydrolase
MAFDRFAHEFQAIASLFQPGTLEQLRALYDEPARAYHNRQHILTLLHLLNRLEPTIQLEDKQALLAAIFFHDAIYQIPQSGAQPRPQDNESRSVVMMLDHAHNPQHESLQKAARMILMTIDHHCPVQRGDMAVMHDLDLSILATSTSRFARFEQQIRQEYAVYPLSLYCMGRASSLRGLLDDRQIFSLPPLAQKWDDKARHNIKAACRALSCGRVVEADDLASPAPLTIQTIPVA